MSAATIRVHNRANAPQYREFVENRCLLAVQAKVRGFQELRVEGHTKQATGLAFGYIGVRVGQCMIYLEDREALFSWMTAIQRAAELADAAFGPDLPSAKLGPRRRVIA